MDPVSQGVVGAIAAASVSSEKRRNDLRYATLAGWLGGLLPDADIFIRSAEDPLLNIEYHRHFSHSFAFIPIGGLIVAGFLWLFLRKSIGFRRLLVFSTLGYATAGLLDACTSYGTQLLWPISDQRIAWNIISIIDPIFTLTLVILSVIALFRQRAILPRISVGFALAYLSLCVVQNRRASAVQADLVASREHTELVEMATVKPSLGNLLLWRSIYRVDGEFHIDAIRVGLGSGKVFEGEQVEAYDLDELRRGLDPYSTLADDLGRFAHFSSGYLGPHPTEPNVVADLRYAMAPHSAHPLWGIQIDRENPDQHVAFDNFRDQADREGSEFLRMLRGNPPAPESSEEQR
ncbi:MAG: metal-dependent hydrolase [Verrucomicrobiota bacterium]